MTQLFPQVVAYKHCNEAGGIFLIILWISGLEMCGLPIGLSFFGTLWVNDRSDGLWFKTAKWFIGLLSDLRQ